MADTPKVSEDVRRRLIPVDVSDYIASLEADRARLDVLEEILLSGRIASHGAYGILVRYDVEFFHQSKSLREAADAEIQRRANVR